MVLQSGNTALSLAKRLGYITIEDVLKTVTTETTTIVSCCHIIQFHICKWQLSSHLLMRYKNDLASLC